jgi:hypothetical protein
MSTLRIGAAAAAMLIPLALGAAHGPPTPPAASQPQASTSGVGATGEWDSVPFNLLPLSMQRDPRVNLSVLTEMTPEGRQVKPPTRAHPAYFVAHDQGLTEEGDIVAGEVPPSKAVLGEALYKGLSVNGYLPATNEHAPALVIDLRWGAFNKLNFTQKYDDLELVNLAERAAIVGGMQFSADMMRAFQKGNRILKAFRMQSPRNDWLVDRAMGDLYFVIASAYDANALAEGRLKLLWRTKMSTASQGVTMDGTIPALVVSSGPFFGRETAGAMRLNRPVIKDGKVEIGTATIKGYLDETEK